MSDENSEHSHEYRIKPDEWKYVRKILETLPNPDQVSIELISFCEAVANMEGLTVDIVRDVSTRTTREIHIHISRDFTLNALYLSESDLNTSV